MNATLATNLAAMESYLEVTTSEANAYQNMKTKLDFAADADMLNYIKVKAINSFNPSNLLIGVPE